MVEHDASIGKCSQATLEDIRPDDIRDILKRHGDNPAELIGILGDIQTKYRYLPQEAIRIVAQVTGASLVDVYGAATFYRSFSLTPKGEHLIMACLGTACHVRGASGIVEEIQRCLEILPGETTPDGRFTFETANCLGACALGPVVVVDGLYHSKVRKSGVRRLISGALKGPPKIDVRKDKTLVPIDVSCPRCYHSLMDSDVDIDGRASIGLIAAANSSRGLVNLSSIYGSYNLVLENEIPVDAIASLFCPHCEEELIGSWECPICAAQMCGMAVRGGGTLHICTRRGCKHHLLDIT